MEETKTGKWGKECQESDCYFVLILIPSWSLLFCEILTTGQLMVTICSFNHSPEASHAKLSTDLHLLPTLDPRLAPNDILDSHLFLRPQLRFIMELHLLPKFHIVYRFTSSKKFPYSLPLLLDRVPPNSVPEPHSP